MCESALRFDSPPGTEARRYGAVSMAINIDRHATRQARRYGAPAGRRCDGRKRKTPARRRCHKMVRTADPTRCSARVRVRPPPSPPW